MISRQGSTRKLTHLLPGSKNRIFIIVPGKWEDSTVEALIGLWPDDRLTRTHLAEALGFLGSHNKPNISTIASKVDKLVKEGRLQKRVDSAKVSRDPQPGTIGARSTGKKTLGDLASLSGVDTMIPVLPTRTTVCASTSRTPPRRVAPQATAAPEAAADSAAPSLIEATDSRFENDGIYCTHKEKPGKIWLRCSASATRRNDPYCTVRRPAPKDPTARIDQFVPGRRR